MSLRRVGKYFLEILRYVFNCFFVELISLSAICNKANDLISNGFYFSLNHYKRTFVRAVQSKNTFNSFKCLKTHLDYVYLLIFARNVELYFIVIGSEPML